MTPNHPSRRDALRAGLMAGAGLALGRLPVAAQGRIAGFVPTQQSLITKPIPSTGEQIPAVGLGTNRYSVSTPEEMAPLREVLAAMPDLGGSVIDTAHGYGRSEAVIGELLEGLGNRDRFFLSTKVSGTLDDGVSQLQESFTNLRTDMLDLVSVHNLRGTDEIIPMLQEQKQEGRVRYVGVTTSSTRSHTALMEVMRQHDLDFIQVNYSIGSREAADNVLPLAQERGMAVMLNVPFGGRRGSIFGTVAGKELPAWAADFDCESWAQFALEYLISHPAVTVPIPGTTDVEHLADNLGALRGRLPDEETRTRMAALFDALEAEAGRP